MADFLERTELLFSPEEMERLNKATVCVFGVGGVGGYVCEALARTGVGHMVLVDNDTVSVSNINRQIIALHSTLGRYKVDVMQDRIKDINPEAEVTAKRMFFLPENADSFDFSRFSYVVDAVDTVSAKVAIIEKCKAAGVPVISSMGAGNKCDPSKFQVADIYKTEMDPLAKVMRNEMKKRRIKKLKVVFSTEKPMEVREKIVNENKKVTPGSLAFVPSAAGLLIASEVIKDIIKG